MAECLLCPVCNADLRFRPGQEKIVCFFCEESPPWKDRLIVLKKATGKSYRLMAHELKINQRTFENWCCGRTVPNQENVTKILEYMKIQYSKK